MFPDYANAEAVMPPTLTQSATYTVIEDAYYQLGIGGSQTVSNTLSIMKIDNKEALVMLCNPAFNRAVCIYPIKKGSVITCESNISVYFYITKFPFRK